MPTVSKSPLAVGVDLRALVGTPTGIGYYTLSMLHGLAETGLFRLVGMAHETPEYQEELIAAGVEVEVRRALSGVIWQQTVVPLRLRRGDLDLFWSPILTLPLSLPVPALTTVHDLTPLLHPETHTLKVRWSILPFLARNLSSAAAVIADSESTADDLRRYYPDCRERLEVIYPGVDDLFQPGGPEQIAETRAELGCPEGYLLFSGTLEPRKNLDLLLDAWEIAREAEERTLPLILSGPAGWADKAFFQRLKQLEPAGVRWLGRVSRPELLRLMQGARWFVYPSLYEGFGLPVAEAMACGIPPIVSQLSSLPEVVGDAGYQVDPYEPEDLAGLLQSLTQDPAQEADLAQKARRRASRFSWKTASDQLGEAFLRVASAGIS